LLVNLSLQFTVDITNIVWKFMDLIHLCLLYLKFDCGDRGDKLQRLNLSSSAATLVFICFKRLPEHLGNTWSPNESALVSERKSMLAQP
jgi:hypothetical protein